MTTTMTKQQVHTLLEEAWNNGTPVDITTEWSAYTECILVSVGDTEVEFTAIHPVKDCEYDFRLQLAEFRTVQDS